MKCLNDLTKDIRFFDQRDDHDWMADSNQKSFYEEIEYIPTTVTHPETGEVQTMTECNLSSLKEQFYKIKNTCKCILEIGVDCNMTPTERTSTRVFLDNKNSDTFYFGLDINNKKYLDNSEKNIITIQENSSNIENVMKVINSYGIEKIDFLFIDGWHSINQVMKEWEYTKYISDNAIIGFHDTFMHPGPNLFLKYLDTEKWNVIENSCYNPGKDFGIGFVWKK
jgi:hypothetical protein